MIPFYLVNRGKAKMTGSSLVKPGWKWRQLFRVSRGFLEFNPEGAKQFAQVTKRTSKNNWPSFWTGVVQSAPVIRTRIPDRPRHH